MGNSHTAFAFVIACSEVLAGEHSYPCPLDGRRTRPLPFREGHLQHHTQLLEKPTWGGGGRGAGGGAGRGGHPPSQARSATPTLVIIVVTDCTALTSTFAFLCAC